MTMALQRSIVCPLCPEESRKLVLPFTWTSDQGLAWFHNDHMLIHVSQTIDEAVAITITASPVCRRCRHTKDPGHRACYDPGCYCGCSYPTTTPGRNADVADD